MANFLGTSGTFPSTVKIVRLLNIDQSGWYKIWYLMVVLIWLFLIISKIRNLFFRYEWLVALKPTMVSGTQYGLNT